MSYLNSASQPIYMRDKIDSDINLYFKKYFKRDLTETEILEWRQSLFYFGRAIHKYLLQIEKVPIKNDILLD